MQFNEQQTGSEYIVSQADVPFPVDNALFNPAVLKTEGYLQTVIGGRGAAYFFSKAGYELVLRHYRRGGLIGPLLFDQYLWTGLRRTRAWQEFWLLADLFAAGFPVPEPFAARVQRQGIKYRADLITQRIPESIALSVSLQKTALSDSFWQQIGVTLRRFHDEDICHADLNAHNILLKGQEVYLVDFDKGKIKRGVAAIWKRQNLERLQRSLLKLKQQNEKFYFKRHDWQQLLSGYYPS